MDLNILESLNKVKDVQKYAEKLGLKVKVIARVPERKIWGRVRGLRATAALGASDSSRGRAPRPGSPTSSPGCDADQKDEWVCGHRRR
jgi:hypothetical protein